MHFSNTFKYKLTQSRGGGGWVGGEVLQYFHTHVTSGHFFGFNILNFIFFFFFFFGGGGGPENEYFGFMKILWIFFGVIIKLDYIQGSFLCILGSF